MHNSRNPPLAHYPSQSANGRGNIKDMLYRTHRLINDPVNLYGQN